MGPYLLKVFIMTNIGLLKTFLSIDRGIQLFNLRCFAHNKALIYQGNTKDVFTNQVCLFICVRGSVHPVILKTIFRFACCLVLRSAVITLHLNIDWPCRVVFVRCANLAFLTCVAVGGPHVSDPLTGN